MRLTTAPTSSLLLATAGLALARPVPDAASTSAAADGACASYTIIDTRGTGEFQGPSVGFIGMNQQLMAGKAGGTVYSTVYAAGIDQNSAAGTTDIVNHITTTLAANPSTCFILEGYSQGAAATVNALPRITGAAFDAVKGVFMIGDPYHKSGLACNVDNNGGTSTRNVNGLEQLGVSASVPTDWVSKTLDVCIAGDGVCDTAQGLGITLQHLMYGGDANVQSMGAKFGIAVLNGQTYTHQ